VPGARIEGWVADGHGEAPLVQAAIAGIGASYLHDPKKAVSCATAAPGKGMIE
jgi:hypothetical protein